MPRYMYVSLSPNPAAPGSVLARLGRAGSGGRGRMHPRRRPDPTALHHMYAARSTPSLPPRYYIATAIGREHGAGQRE